MQQYKDFIRSEEMLNPEQIVILYERGKDNDPDRNKASQGSTGGGTSEEVETEEL